MVYPRILAVGGLEPATEGLCGITGGLKARRSRCWTSELDTNQR
jgi:hypothetical protein